MSYLFAIDLIPVAVDALTNHPLQTEITRELIRNEFPADEYDGFILPFHAANKIQQLHPSRKKFLSNSIEMGSSNESYRAALVIFSKDFDVLGDGMASSKIQRADTHLKRIVHVNIGDPANSFGPRSTN